MMGRQNNDLGPLFYEFRLDEAVPDDHLVRNPNSKPARAAHQRNLFARLSASH